MYCTYNTKPEHINMLQKIGPRMYSISLVNSKIGVDIVDSSRWIVSD